MAIDSCYMRKYIRVKSALTIQLYNYGYLSTLRAICMLPKQKSLIIQQFRSNAVTALYHITSQHPLWRRTSPSYYGVHDYVCMHVRSGVHDYVCMHVRSGVYDYICMHVRSGVHDYVCM